MAPGVNGLGRQTGTVPKTKTHNDSAREYAAAVRREQARSNIPNNLTPHDWQLVPDPSQSRARKTSNTRTAALEYFDLVSDPSVSQDNSRFAPAQYPQADDDQGPQVVVDRNSVDINGCKPSSGLRRDSARRTPRNVMPDKENKSNISKMPDRNQVVIRLNQIRDYIHQTSSLMDTLKNSGDSITLDSRNSTPVARTVSSQPRLSAALSSTSASSSRANSEELSGAVLKSSDSTRRNELKIKVEESQRKLQALQEHQTALLSLQQKAQDQLKEARAAQGALLSRATAPFTNAEESADENLQDNVENIQDRLQALHELYDNRNQLVALMGERDEELVSEHMVLQDKLQELQSKKQHMDHLVAEFQSLNNLPPTTEGVPIDDGATSSREGSEDGSDVDMDCQVVRDKMAELSAMKAQLAHLQNLMRQTEMGTGQEPLESQLPHQGTSLSHQTEVPVQQEDQAVNLRRQQRDKGRTSLARTNSNASTTKPDNISQAGADGERTRDINSKATKLQDAKAHLQQLQELLAAVTEMRGRGEPIPSHYLQLLVEESDRDCYVGGGDGGHSNQELPTQLQQESPNELTLEVVNAMARDLRQQTQALQEERDRLVQAQRELGKMERDLPLPLREKKTNTQVDALQAKRRELEELMRKDQGQTSIINQDVCSELSAGKSETPGYSYLGEGTSNATWGGSTQGTLDDLAERDDDVQGQSAGYSSDEAQDEERNRTVYLASQLKHLQLNSTPTTSSSNIINNKDSMVQSTISNRDVLNMSLESGVFGNIHSNATSVAGSIPAPPSLPCRGPQRPGPHNVWRKASTDSSATLPRAIWTPSSQNLNTADEQGANLNNSSGVNNEVESSNSNVTMQHIPSQTSSSSNSNWWQQHAIQLQNQLEATSSLYHSLLLEQQQQQQQQQQSNLPWPPPLPAMPWRLPMSGSTATGLGTDSNIFYQQLLAASHMQQQQVLLTTVNQCCHLLWLQQREMATLRAAVVACSVPQPPVQPAAGSPWLQSATLPAVHANASPVPALNNQVPPGNRANNYWDNFRSYSRQNLLSTSTKSNEGVSHSPSPLVDRSHNTLRSSVAIGPQLGMSSQPVYQPTDQGLPAPHNVSRKEKLNIEPYQGAGDNYTLGASSVLETAELQYQLLGSTGRTQSNNECQLQSVGTEPGTSQLWQTHPRAFRGQRGNCKRKNPRAAAQPAPDLANQLSTSRTSVTSPPQDRNVANGLDSKQELQHCRVGLFDVLSESVYTEVAALIAANKERPHFLIQLFRDLQMVSSDPLRRRTLQSIHELVSRYLSAVNANGTGDGLQREQNPNQTTTNEYTGSNSLASSEEDDNTNEKVQCFQLAPGPNPHSEMQETSIASSSGEPLMSSQEANESEGAAAAPAAAMPPSPRAQPRNAAWNNKDVISLPVELPGRGCKLDWEVQAVLVDVLPFLKAHLDEACSPALLEAVRALTVQLVPAQTRPPSHTPTPSHPLLGGYFQGQLDALLEDALHKFLGCRLRDVGEELLTVVAEIVQSELTFFRLVDTVRRREVDDANEGVCKNPSMRECGPEEPSNCLSMHLATESAAQTFAAPSTNSQSLVEPLSGGPEAYNGDLAEADQSHHEEAAVGNSSPTQRPGSGAATSLPQDSHEISNQITEHEPVRADEQDSINVLLTGDSAEEQIKTEVGSCWQAEDEWEVEQDREQGLDRVPTRLTDESDTQDKPAANLTDVPNP